MGKKSDSEWQRNGTILQDWEEFYSRLPQTHLGSNPGSALVWAASDVSPEIPPPLKFEWTQ